MAPDSSDTAENLVLMSQGGFPRVLHSGVQMSGCVWSPAADRFLVQSGNSIMLGNMSNPFAPLHTCIELPSSHKFDGNRVVWGRDDRILYSTTGGTPKRSRLHLFVPPEPFTDQYVAAVVGAADDSTIFVAEAGGSLLSMDFAPVGEMVSVVHRRANAMIAQVLLVSCADRLEPPRVIAVDGRVEYCKPRVAFLSDGRLILRLNLVATSTANGLMADTDVDVTNGLLPPVHHGIYTCAAQGDGAFTPVKPDCLLDCDADEQNSPRSAAAVLEFDTCSNSYGGERNIGVREGFVLDRTRRIIAFTARPHSHTGSVPSMCDELWMVDLSADRAGTTVIRNPSEKGCHVPIYLQTENVDEPSLEGTGLVYHFRSPSEWGDLYLKSGAETTRLTETMPISLKHKLSHPVEVRIPNGMHNTVLHALLYYPLPDQMTAIKQVQPLVWAHGGPMTCISYDFNPLFNYLASLGYVVCVPNFRGSTGFGVDFMDAVLRDGCGVADVSDCFAAAEFLTQMVKGVRADQAAKDLWSVNKGLPSFDRCLPEGMQVGYDLQRGVGVAGHSWGGYLAFMCLCCPPAETDFRFSCGIASAGITDWFIQQRYTEVRYYDFTIMGGWVYEDEIAVRARRAGPITYAAQLQAPLLVLHGEDDIDVPFKQIAAFVAAAKHAEHPKASVSLTSYPGEGHGMVGIVAQNDVLSQMKDFLRVNLKPWDFTDNPHGDLTAY